MKIFLKIYTTKVVLFLKGCNICVICVICGSIFIFLIDKRILENYNKIMEAVDERKRFFPLRVKARQMQGKNSLYYQWFSGITR